MCPNISLFFQYFPISPTPPFYKVYVNSDYIAKEAFLFMVVFNTPEI